MIINLRKEITKIFPNTLFGFLIEFDVLGLDDRRETDCFLQLHQPFFILVPFHQNHGHLYSSETLPLRHWNITFFLLRVIWNFTDYIYIFKYISKYETYFVAWLAPWSSWALLQARKSFAWAYSEIEPWHLVLLGEFLSLLWAHLLLQSSHLLRCSMRFYKKNIISFKKKNVIVNKTYLVAKSSLFSMIKFSTSLPIPTKLRTKLFQILKIKFC